jgi:Na+/H+-translocating membrane pyrophosphatase
LTLTLLSFALAWWIDQELNTAVSFLIVGVIWAVVGFVLMSAARKKLKDVEVLPTTKETIKEDLEWAKAQKR